MSPHAECLPSRETSPGCAASTRSPIPFGRASAGARAQWTLEDFFRGGRGPGATGPPGARSLPHTNRPARPGRRRCPHRARRIAGAPPGTRRKKPAHRRTRSLPSWGDPPVWPNIKAGRAGAGTTREGTYSRAPQGLQVARDGRGRLVLSSRTLEIIGPIQAVGPDHVVMLTGERIAVPADLLEKAKIVVGLLATISVE